MSVEMATRTIHRALKGVRGRGTKRPEKMESSFPGVKVRSATQNGLGSTGRGLPTIRDYHLLRVIGSGSFGDVWLGRSLAGALRAVKVIYRNPAPNDHGFDREFAGLQKFEPISHRHPGWVRILHVGKNDQEGHFYYVMEAADDCARQQEIVAEDYCPRTLSSELARRGRLPRKEILDLGVSLTAALEALHQHNLVHRDVKGSNVIYVNGEPKLADIGLVARIGEPRTSWSGTMGYFPPEGSGTASADIFALGRLLYVLWTDMDARNFPELPNDLEGSSDPLTRVFNELILKACESKPEDRFKSAQAMQDALKGLLSDEQKPARPRTASTTNRTAPGTQIQQYVAIIGHCGGKSNQQLSELLQDNLPARGWPVILDKHTSVGIEWAWQIDSKAPKADAVVVLLSSDSAQSEMVTYELELAREASLRRGKPILIPVRVQYSDPLPVPLARILHGTQCLQWRGPDDDEAIVAKILSALESPLEWRLVEPANRYETPWGAMPLSSTFYVVRAADYEFRTAITRHDSIVLVRGARQMGKSSLLARGLDEARSRGVLVVFTDFQGLSGSDFESLERFYYALGDSISDQLELDVSIEDTWDSRRSPNTNFDRFLRREVFDKLGAHIVWGLDEVDRLFSCDFGSEVFGMFRSWHNKRALDPDGHWANLTLAIAYATEAHLFITDLNQSPFNVGTPLTLEDFKKGQVDDLNRRYGNPLTSEEQLNVFFRLLNGHPFLVRRGLHELATRRMPFDVFESQAARDEGIFGDHLRRMLVTLAKDPALVEVVRDVLKGGRVDADNFYRLRGAGVMAGETAGEARMRCQVYTDFLRRHLL